MVKNAIQIIIVVTTVGCYCKHGRQGQCHSAHSGRPQENHLDWALSNNASKFGPLNHELRLNGLLLSDILPYPLFHCHVRLPVIRVCFAVCLMSHSFRYPQFTASGYLNLASVIAGPNTCGLTIVPCSMKPWVAISMWSDSPPIYICICICICNFNNL